MDGALAILLSFPPHPTPQQPLSDTQYDEGIKALVENVRKLGSRDLTQANSSGESVLDVIDPSVNSISYLTVLLAHIPIMRGVPNTMISKEVIWARLIAFLDVFDSRQMRYAGSDFTNILESMVDLARHSGQLESAVPHLANAISRLDPSCSTLTSNHLLLVQIALQAQAPTEALRVINQPILYFPSKNRRPPTPIGAQSLPADAYIIPESGLTRALRYQDVVEYFILAGTIHIMVQQWDKALEAFECAIAYPVKDSAVSKIMIDAYKKWILVHLISRGIAGSLSPTISIAASKTFHTIAKPYEIVASMFESADALRFRREVDAGTQIWTDDKNMGLIGLVLRAYQRFQICKLGNVYQTLSVATIIDSTTSAETGTKLSTEEAGLTLIDEMIASSTLAAALCKSSKDLVFLKFDDTTAKVLEHSMQKELAVTISRLSGMATHVKSTDHRLSHDKEFLRWAYKLRVTNVKGSSDVELATTDAMPWEISTPDMEEDLMGIY